MELCTKWSLQDLVTARAKAAANKHGAPLGHQGLSEVEVRYFMTQILQALDFLHTSDNQIIHRDLSLKNIFIGTNGEKTMQAKIGDFGMSIKLDRQQTQSLRNSFCGTYQFIAPELYQNEVNHEKFGYSLKNDIWAVGVIFYTLLTGSNPFTQHATSLEHLKKLIKGASYKMPGSKADVAQKLNNKVSTEARDLVFRLLQATPASRPTVREVLNHPFFTFKPIVPLSLPESIMARQLNQQELIQINEEYILNTKRQIEALSETNLHLPAYQQTELPPLDEIDYFEQQVQTQKAIFERIQNQIRKDEILTRLCLVKQWVSLDKYGTAYCLVNGNFGIAFKDHTHMYLFSEPDRSQNTLVEMVSYMPRDASAQIFFRKGDKFADSLAKKVKVFEKSIKQLKYQIK
jgi:serine/threonine protein kinase